MSAPLEPIGGPIPVAPTRGASFRLRIGDRIALDAEIGLQPLRLAAVAFLVAAILAGVPPIIRAARERRPLPPAP